MAGRVNLYTVDHHDPFCNPDGGIVTTFPVGPRDSLLGTVTFADMVAQYFMWRGKDLVYPPIPATPQFKPDDIIGFQGYRKHLDFRLRRDVKGDFVSLDALEFRQYQIWQQDCAGPNIEFLLQDCDILTNPPYSVAHNKGIKEDWCISASATDWAEMERVMKQYGEFDFNIPTVTSYCVFTGTHTVFDEWMTFWWKVVCELVQTLPVPCPDPGPRPDIYLPRRMAFLSERIYSLWLASSRLRTQALPLIVCWELQ